MSTTHFLRVKLEPVVRVICAIIHYIYNYKLNRYIGLFISYLYTFWVIPNFRKVGIGTIFYRPIKLIGGKHITIGNYTVFGKHCVICAWDKYNDIILHPNIEIGNGCDFGEYNHITCINKVSIGHNVLTGRWVTISDNSHGISIKEMMKIPPTQRPIYSKGPIIIGNNVWIGDKATILPNISIGNGAIIAANSVVTKNVPEYCVVAGNPAKIIKQNND